MGAMSSKPLTPATTLRQRARFYTVEWYWASRPVTLTASVVPVLVGSALAFQEGQGSGLLLALMLLASVLVQVGMNLVDEYADDATPARGRKLLAPYKVIARGVLSRRAVQQGAWLSFGVATAIGVYIVVAAGWPILAVCVASLAAAYFYAAGPKPLGTLGLGVPLVFVFMGPVMVMAAYYVHTGESTLSLSGCPCQWPAW